VEVEGEEEYIVEEILDLCLRRNKLEFLVKWEGYMNENICGNRRTIVEMRAMLLPPSTGNILRRQDKLRGYSLMVSIFDLIKIYSTKHFYDFSPGS